MNFRALRDRIMTYRDDFIRTHTVERVGRIAEWLGPYLENAQGNDAYILRGIAHFRGQCSLRDRTSLWALEGVSALLLLAAPFLLISGFFKKIQPSAARAYFILLAPVSPVVAKLYKVPDELSGVETPKDFVPRRWHLSGADWRILGQLVYWLLRTRCPFPLQYIWKAIKDMALIRGYIDRYPDATYGLIAGEYSCSLSLHSLQHRLAGRELYNVMHGDNASTPMESFFKIDRFYAWDAAYIDLFRDQRIDADFRVSPNPDFRLKDGESLASSGIGVVIPMINFLPDQFESMDALVAAFGGALKGYAGLCLRPHPAYPQTYEICAVAADTPHKKSDPRVQTPHEFILANRVIVGFYSTVLVEAAHMGAKVVIVRGDGSVARADYHGIFKMANVRHVPLESLHEGLADFISAEDKENKNVA